MKANDGDPDGKHRIALLPKQKPGVSQNALEVAMAEQALNRKPSTSMGWVKRLFRASPLNWTFHMFSDASRSEIANLLSYLCTGQPHDFKGEPVPDWRFFRQPSSSRKKDMSMFQKRHKEFAVERDKLLGISEIDDDISNREQKAHIIPSFFTMIWQMILPVYAKQP